MRAPLIAARAGGCVSGRPAPDGRRRDRNGKDGGRGRPIPVQPLFRRRDPLAVSIRPRRPRNTYLHSVAEQVNADEGEGKTVVNVKGGGESEGEGDTDGEGDVKRDDPAARRTWSFGNLEGVMLGVSRPLVRLGGEVYNRWASASDESEVGIDAAVRDEKERREADARGEESTAVDDAEQNSDQGAGRGSSGGFRIERLVGTAMGGVNTWVADRRERARAAAAAAAQPPPLVIAALTAAHRAQIELGADEIHFLPVPDSGWSLALLRYRPKVRRPHPGRPTAHGPNFSRPAHTCRAAYRMGDRLPQSQPSQF